MDYKKLFGYAAILFGLGFFVRSFLPAYAYNGPNTSMGSNPIDHATAICSNLSSSLIFSNSTTSTFVVTEVIRAYPSYGAGLSINGNRIFNVEGFSNGRSMFSFDSGLTVQPGESVYCGHGGYRMTISGYYTH